MSTIANLLIKVGVDVNDADATLHRFGGKAGTGLRKAFLPAVGVLTALGVAAKLGFDEFKTAQRVTAQTNAVLKSTGGVANVTTAEIQDLAGALMQKSGVDDEVIQSGANMLLTFTNIRNEVGKGNNVFDQATATVLDMSVAMGTDMKSSAILVGKALNNPIKGLSALQRVGVTFTAGQQKAIKAMVDSGNTMGAQKVILKELQKEFGGSAAAAGKTLSGQLAIAEQTFMNLAGSIVGAVLPAFTGFANILNGVLGWMTKHETATKVIIGVVGGLAAAIVAANVALRVQAATTTLVTAAKLTAAGATKAWTAAQWLLNAALRANPLGIIITLIAAVAAGIVVAYNRSSTFRSIVQAAFNAVKAAANAVASAVDGIVSAMVAAWKHPVVQAITAPYRAAFSAIKAVVENTDNAIRAILNAVRAVKDSPAVQALDNVFGTVFSAIKSVINSVADAINNVISKVRTAISWVDNLAGKVSSVVGKAGSLASKALPFLAEGGIVTRATPAVVGEAGPEVVIPLTRPRRAAQLMAQTGLDRMAGGDGGGPTIHVDTMVVQDATDIDRVASRLGRQLLMAV